MAGRKGFEPSRAIHPTRVPVVRLRPLGHLPIACTDVHSKYLFPDGCGTRERGVGCYVPILTRCPSVPLHRSEKRQADYIRISINKS